MIDIFWKEFKHWIYIHLLSMLVQFLTIQWRNKYKYRFCPLLWTNNFGIYIIMRDKFKYSSQITTTVRLVLLFKHFLFFKVSWHLKLLPVQHLGFDVCELWPFVLQFPGWRSNEFANIWPRVLSLLAPTTKVIYFICGVFLNDTISSM